ncbi:MAG TPA: DinB family protein [bacterium]
MLELDDPYTKRTLIPALQKTGQYITDTFKALSLDDLFIRPDNSWSAADHLLHLIKSNQPILKALRTPKLFLMIFFGMSKTPSQRFGQIKERYLKELQGGLQAGRFAPDFREKPYTEHEAEDERKKIIKTWIKQAKSIIIALNGWSERDLDHYRLPHPALGKVSMREMLLFSLYHNLHHTYNVQKKVQKP